MSKYQENEKKGEFQEQNDNKMLNDKNRQDEVVKLLKFDVIKMIKTF